MTCPLCGQQMQATEVAGAPPWLCGGCARAWWEPELTVQAREALRPALRDFGVGEPAALIALAVQVHLDDAGGPGV